MSNAEDLEKLNRLRSEGAISEEEYQQLKQKIINNQGFAAKLSTMDSKSINTWSMIMHLSVFLPFGGIIVPIVMWAIKKDESEIIDQHGRNIINWIISAFIYSMVSGILILVLIGIPMLFVLSIACIVFPIMGGIKANEGIIWKYPLAIKFL